MTLRQVTPANGAAQLQISWDGGLSSVLQAGAILDVPVGSALESAIGLANLTALTGKALNDAQTGSGASGTDNS